MPKKQLFIKEFSALAEKHPNTIRNWQLKGILPDRRTPMGYRVFYFEDLKKIKTIIKKHGKRKL